MKISPESSEALHCVPLKVINSQNNVKKKLHCIHDLALYKQTVLQYFIIFLLELYKILEMLNSLMLLLM